MPITYYDAVTTSLGQGFSNFFSPWTPLQIMWYLRTPHATQFANPNYSRRRLCIAIGIEFKLLVSEVDFVSHICSHKIKITTLILDSRCHYSRCHTTATELSLINMKKYKNITTIAMFNTT